MNPAQATFEAGKLREQEERQAKFNETIAANQIPFLEHQREVEGRAEEALRVANADLDQRIAAAVKARGVSFEPTAVPGDGWASVEFRRIVGAASGNARDHFTTLVHAERELELAKKALGATIASPILARPVVHTTELREQIDLCEARFEYAYEQLKLHRTNLRDPAFVAVIEQLNERAQSAFFTPYVTDRDPEMEQIAGAVRTLLDAFASIADRQQAKLNEHSQATTLARELGFTREQVGESYRTIQMWFGQSMASRAAKVAADAWQRERVERKRLEITEWLPSFDHPWG